MLFFIPFLPYFRGFMALLRVGSLSYIKTKNGAVQQSRFVIFRKKTEGTVYRSFSELLNKLVKSIVLSHISRAAGRCVTMTTVLSVICRKLMSSRFSVCSSNADVASSRRSIGLSEKMARAMAIRCI